MDWDNLRYVLAVSRAGTMTGAAERLGVTRTTVGRRIKEAEERLGVVLFDRTPEGLVPTVSGEELAQTAAHVEAQVMSTEARIVGQDTTLTGALRVSTLNFVFDGFTEVFSSFMERYPGVVLTVSVTEDRVSLHRREADVALRLENKPTDTLVGRRVGLMKFGAYAARSLVERVGADAPLGAYPWLQHPGTGEARWHNQWLAEHAPGAAVVLRSAEYSVIQRAVTAGIGVHFMPCFQGDADPRLVSVADLEGQGRQLWVLTLSDLRHNRRVRAFMEHVFEGFKPHQTALLGG